MDQENDALMRIIVLFNAIRPLSYLAQRNGLNVGIIMVDVDDLKAFNDTHGHREGDGVLARVAKLIETRMRKSDIVGRYGGEEFIVFLPEVDHRAMYRICNDVRERVEKETRGKIPVTVSVGAASGLLDVDANKDVMTLINKADVCLYSAKRGGKNRVAVDGE